jgi:uncharacterized damage-inducible protein DinB
MTVSLNQIVDAWKTTNAATVYLVSHVPAQAWKQEVPGIPRKTIGAISAHLHNSRCGWIKSLGAKHGVTVPRRVDFRRATKSEVIAALPRSSQGMIAVIELGAAHGGRLPPAVWQNFPTDLAHFLGYFAAHEGHHRGQLIMALRQLGHRLPQEVVNGVWQWTRFARAAGVKRKRR